MLERHTFARQGKPQSKIDVAAVVGQFLAELSLHDLVVELVQNDLDAGATRTVITFGETALISEGNGASVDANGWKRLGYVLGAGGEVEAKKDGIGSKNHGLRALFLLADEVWVQSGGYRVDLTARGRADAPGDFYPASWERSADPSGPAVGTRITAEYRTERLKKPDGDGTFLEPPTVDQLNELWLGSAQEAAERFITASAPGKPWRYELVLSRAGKEPHSFIFECKSLTGDFKEIHVRSCKRRIGTGPSEQAVRRHCTRFLIDETDLGPGKVPRLFRSAGRTYGEISWCVDRRNRPTPTIGLLRYPIAFPEESALSGAGFDISAPFIAGRARHALSEDARNGRLINAGRLAFAAIAGRRLAKAYGPRLGVLVRSQGRPDEKCSDLMAELLLQEGALSICVPRAAGKSADAAPMKRSDSLTVACSLEDAERIDEPLCKLARKLTNVLHPQTPADLVGRIVRKCRDEIKVFDERSAAKAAFVDDIPSRSDDGRVGLCLETLEALERLRRRSGALPKEIVSDLEQRGKLPIIDGSNHPWREIRRSKSGLPSVPGIQDPKIIHQSLADSAVLSTSSLRLKEFQLDELLHKRNFDPVIPEGRQRFFDWLKANAGIVKKERLAEITEYPIWPGADGKHRKLGEYCRPKERRIAAVLKGVCLEPSRDVIALAASTAAKGRLKLRTQPTIGEFKAWYSESMSTVDRHAAANNIAAASDELRRLEDKLDVLLTRRVLIEDVAQGHRTIAQDGQLRSINTLHAISPLISACALPAEFLCKPRRSDLYRQLGAQEKPSRQALVEALRRDPVLAKLFIRLEQYKRAGHDLAELSAEPIVPTANGVQRACDLAFKAERDMWGAFKIKLEKLTSAPSDHALLVALGVTTSSLKTGQSPEFFQWLSKQTRKVKQDHLPQILRHWRDTAHGPAYWAADAKDIKCIPVYGRDQQMELLTVNEATSLRSLVFLDDFPELKAAAIASGRVRLAIDTDGKHASVITEYGGFGVRSLKQHAGLPIAIAFRDEIEVPNQLLTDLRRLQSSAVSSTLKSRLPRYGVPLSDVKNDIKNLVKGISGVRFGKDLVASYAVAGMAFEVATASAVDAVTRTVFVSSETDPSIGFFNALAGYLFRPGSNPQNAWGLMMTVKEQRIGEEFQFLEDDDEEDGEDSHSSESRENDDQILSAHGTSSQIPLTPRAPRPKPLSPIGKPTYLQSRKGRRKMTRGSSTDQKRNSLEEQEHIRALKEEHYAWHCQACLGANEVLKAAPPGTYVYSPNYRRRLIEAHHVDHLQNSGRLGASNLLILCNYHHDLLGDELSRDAVVAGLSGAEKGVRKFPTDMLGKVNERREGLLASVAFSKEPFSLTLFFTKEHGVIWSES